MQRDTNMQRCDNHRSHLDSAHPTKSRRPYDASDAALALQQLFRASVRGISSASVLHLHRLVGNNTVTALLASKTLPQSTHRLAGHQRTPTYSYAVVQRNDDDFKKKSGVTFGQDLSGQDFRGANLSGAILFKANLRGANLTNVNLTEADLTEADLTEANLTGAKLNRAKLTNADLTLAKLNWANLTEAELNWANLTEAELNEARLNKAKLISARLSRANLSGAGLILADLTCANLRNADLRGAILYSYPQHIGAEGLKYANYKGVWVDKRTQWPGERFSSETRIWRSRIWRF